MTDLKERSMVALRAAYADFINKLLDIPGSSVQKQQAFFRFDEGQMWMQNSIMSYSPLSVPVVNEAMQPVDVIPEVQAV